MLVGGELGGSGISVETVILGMVLLLPNSALEFINRCGTSPIIRRDSPICLARVVFQALSSLKEKSGLRSLWWISWCLARALFVSPVLMAIWCSRALSLNVLWVNCSTVEAFYAVGTVSASTAAFFGLARLTSFPLAVGFLPGCCIAQALV